MTLPRRVLIVRVACLLALVASAALIHDTLRPERGFCPLEAACAKARSSALGSFFGVPTSAIGALGFFGMFMLTLLPPVWARRLTRPAAFAAGIAGLVLIGYQAIVLRSFCPFCLVADLSGMLAAVASIGWEEPPVRRAGKSSGGEYMHVRMRWALAALLAVGGPFFWPQPPVRPAWVTIQNPLAFEPEPVPEVAAPTAPEPVAVPVPMPSAPVREPDPMPSGSPMPSSIAADPLSAPWAPGPDGADGTGTGHGSGSAHGSSAGSVARVAEPQPPAPALEPAKPPPPRELLIVEYLNPFCPHCRATHARLEKVLASISGPVRRRRIYVWNTEDAPLWARACACAAAQEKEDQLFEELVKAKDQGLDELRAASARAGVDHVVLSGCMFRREPPPRVIKDKELMKQTKLEGLPTLDIGHRRLMGEQSEAELREAIDAALTEIPAAPPVR